MTGLGRSERPLCNALSSPVGRPPIGASRVRRKCSLEAGPVRRSRVTDKVPLLKAPSKRDPATPQ